MRSKSTSSRNARGANAATAERSSINWDVLGLAAAAIAVLGAALLYMLGWAYEVNWYGYFGMSMSQVRSSPQDVIIQSVPGIVTLVAALGISVLAFAAGRLVLSFYRQARGDVRGSKRKGQRHRDQQAAAGPGIRHADSGIATLWMAEVVLLVIVYLSGQNLASATHIGYETYYLKFVGFIVLLGLEALLPAVAVAWFMAAIVRRIAGNRRLLIWELPDRYTSVVAVAVAILLTLISISAQYGVNDAARGFRGSGRWTIRPVVITLGSRMHSTGAAIQACNTTACTVGPMGLLAENDAEFILIDWKDDPRQDFAFQPGLYIVPKSPSTFVSPFVPAEHPPGATATVTPDPQSVP